MVVADKGNKTSHSEAFYFNLSIANFSYHEASEAIVAFKKGSNYLPGVHDDEIQMLARLITQGLLICDRLKQSYEVNHNVADLAPAILRV